MIVTRTCSHPDIIMTGRGRGGAGGRGRGRGPRNRSRGQNYTGSTRTTKKGLSAALGINVFDYGHKAAADEMRTSWEKLVEYVGTTYGPDISNELQNRQEVVIPQPFHSLAIMTRHAHRVTMIETARTNLAQAREAQRTMLQQAVDDGELEAPMRLALLENEIAEAAFEAAEDVPIQLTDSEKSENSNKWRTYRERTTLLTKHRGQAFSLILGQCTQRLKDKMKQDTDWTTVSTSNDPLEIASLIEKTILAQTEDQYPFATVYEQELGFYTYRQDQLSNAQWYERYNTKVDVSNAIGVTRQHKILLQWTAQEVHNGTDFDALTNDQKDEIREDSAERYLAYVMLRHSAKQHSNLREDMQNDFTKGDNRYPKDRQQTLHLLDRYSKTVAIPVASSEGTAFAQHPGKSGKGKRGQGKRNNDTHSFDTEYWKDKKCYNCGQDGHPANHCPKDRDDDDDKSSSAASTTDASIKKLHKDMKTMSKKLSTVNAQLTQLKEEDSDLSDVSDTEEDSHFQYGLQFTQTAKFEPRIAELFKQAHNDITLDLREVILLDSQSTMDLLCNPALVRKIFKARKPMRLKSNGGTMRVTHQARLQGYNKTVWFEVSAITNIISLANIIDQYRVTYDSDDKAFVVHRQSSGKPDMYFTMHSSGLHYYDPRKSEHYTFINTVSQNMEGFSKRQVKQADVARTLYAKLSYPSWKDFRWIIRSNQIKDCPVTVQDVDNAQAIWGKNIARLKGTTTRSKPKVVAPDSVKIPVEIMKLHNEVFLIMDIFFVNKIPFFLTLSRKIYFTAVNHLAGRTAAQIFKAFKEIYQYYLHRGFRIVYVGGDGEFAAVRSLIESLPGGPRVNLTSRNEHVPEIERRIRVVKERCRATRHGLPFRSLPKLLTIWIVFHTVRLINYFPPKQGISTSLSPKTIMSGETLDYRKHLALQVGTYVQVHEEDNPRNSQVARTRGAIALGPSGNLQGGYKFMALNTGKKITRNSWDAIPMPDTVIARVNALGRDQPAHLIFTDRSGQLIGDVEIPGVDYDPAEEAPLPPIDPTDVDRVEIPGVNGEEQAPQIVDILDDHDTPTAEPPLIVNGNEVQADHFPPDNEVQADYFAPDDSGAYADPTAAVADAMPAEEPVTTPTLRRSTRTSTQTKDYEPSMTGSKYSYAVTQLEKHGVLHPDAHMFVQRDFYLAEPDVAAMIMTQLSLKSGLKQWGDRAYEAAYSEMKQLHLRDTFRPMHWKELAPLQKKMILESHMFLKKKRTGKIKGRTVAGGNKQRGYIPKEDASSPTVATESVMLTCIIDAIEGRDVAVIDIPNAFIQTRVEEEKDMATIRLRGVIVDILCDIAPDVYKSYVTLDKKGNKCLIVQCLNAIYGTMVASLLYYRKFTRSLKSVGFEINPYDPCVANKIVCGSQMTICFHVDDCKLSHVDPKCNDKMIGWLREEYENIFEDGSGAMQVSRGKKHSYLGMDLDFSTPGQVEVTMFDFIDEILEAFDKAYPKCKGTKSTAAPSNLFTVDEDCKKISPQSAVTFHNLVAKTLYSTKRARPDTCTSLAFLTTRVREPDTDDQKKLIHLMQYLRGTRRLPLILSADGSGFLKWWVDASFAVHPNMRGHSGGGLSLGRGFPTVSSTKQKLNTRSSTESELVGADDFMPAVLWTRYFMLSQGYHVRDTIMHQDNMATELLENNGKASSSRRTKHINIRYFFITDRIKKGELTVKWCPTEEMIGDFMTKPVQGKLFKKFRDLIMGIVSLPKNTTERKNQKSS